MTGYLESREEGLLGKPSVISRLAVTIACIILVFLVKSLPELLVITLFSTIYMVYSTRSLGCLKIFTAIAIPVAGVFVFTFLSASLTRALEIVCRIIVLASSSIALVYNASVGEVLWISSPFRRTYTTALVSLASLESALFVKEFVREALEGVRARGVGGSGLRGVIEKYTIIAKILFYKALVRAEETAEVLAVGMIDPRRVKPLYKPCLSYSDLVLIASLSLLILFIILW